MEMTPVLLITLLFIAIPLPAVSVGAGLGVIAETTNTPAEGVATVTFEPACTETGVGQAIEAS